MIHFMTPKYQIQEILEKERNNTKINIENAQKHKKGNRKYVTLQFF